MIDAGDLATGGVQWLRWNAALERFEVRPPITGLDRPWRIAALDLEQVLGQAGHIDLDREHAAGERLCRQLLGGHALARAW